MSSEAALEQPNIFLNHYTCYRCGNQWTDAWDCHVDDDCPHCGARHCSPTDSEDLVITDNGDRTEPSRTTEMSEVQTILVIVSGGVVQDVVCPEGITVIVRDFDVEGVEDEAVVTQGDERFIESVWSANQGDPAEHRC